MSNELNNGYPPAPEGMEGSGAKAPGAGGIVPAGGPSNQRGFSLFNGKGLAYWTCALGGILASSEAPVLSPILMGCGFATAARAGLREKVIAAVIGIASTVVFSASSGVATIANALLACLASLVVAGMLARGKMTSGTACVSVAVLAVAYLCSDAVASAVAGTTLTATVNAIADAAWGALGSTSLSTAAQMQDVKALFGLLWPTTYVLVALLTCAFAWTGALLAVPRAERDQAKVLRLSAFDLPLWAVAVLVACLAGLAVALTFPKAAGGLLLMVCGNLAMVARIAFAVQGLALVSGLVREKGVSPLLAGLLGAAALVLEVQFFVLTIAGLVDAWANFRHLPRGEKPDPQDADTGSANHQ